MLYNDWDDFPRRVGLANASFLGWRPRKHKRGEMTKDTDRFRPAWVNACEWLEEYAKEQGWKWTEFGHGALVARLIDEHRFLVRLVQENDDEKDIPHLVTSPR